MLEWIEAAGGLAATVVGIYLTIGSIGGTTTRFVVGNLVALAGFMVFVIGVDNVLSEDTTQEVCTATTRNEGD